MRPTQTPERHEKNNTPTPWFNVETMLDSTTTFIGNLVNEVTGTISETWQQGQVTNPLSFDENFQKGISMDAIIKGFARGLKNKTYQVDEIPTPRAAALAGYSEEDVEVFEDYYFNILGIENRWDNSSFYTDYTDTGYKENNHSLHESRVEHMTFEEYILYNYRTKGIANAWKYAADQDNQQTHHRIQALKLFKQWGISAADVHANCGKEGTYTEIMESPSAKNKLRDVCDEAYLLRLQGITLSPLQSFNNQLLEFASNANKHGIEKTVMASVTQVEENMTAKVDNSKRHGAATYEAVKDTIVDHVEQTLSNEETSKSWLDWLYKRADDVKASVTGFFKNTKEALEDPATIVMDANTKQSYSFFKHPLKYFINLKLENEKENPKGYGLFGMMKNMFFNVMIWFLGMFMPDADGKSVKELEKDMRQKMGMHPASAAAATVNASATPPPVPSSRLLAARMPQKHIAVKDKSNEEFQSTSQLEATHSLAFA